MASNKILNLAVLSHVQHTVNTPKVVSIVTTFDILNYIVKKAKDTVSFDSSIVDLDASVESVMTLDASVETY
ncbi:hypothetical protein HK096_003060, partial [Nowakowskiella sp. JEL0078]